MPGIRVSRKLKAIDVIDGLVELVREDHPSVMAAVRAFLSGSRFIRGMTQPLTPTLAPASLLSVSEGAQEHLTS